MKESMIDCYVPAVKEALNQGHKDTRLGFALEHLTRSEEDWKHVIFSDEKMFDTTESRPRHCWRPRNTRYDPNNVAQVQRSGRSVSMWGWIWGYGAELAMTDGHLTGEKYIEILEEVLLPTVRAMVIPEPNTIKFVQDLSPIHQCIIVRQWFAEHPEIELIQWPPKGCDLNPIENVWAIMARDWHVEVRNADEVGRKAREVWEGIRRRPDLCSALAASMPRRLEKVVAARGGWTSY